MFPGLSDGGIAGVVIGSVVAAVLITFAIALFVRQRRADALRPYAYKPDVTELQASAASTPVAPSNTGIRPSMSRPKPALAAALNALPPASQSRQAPLDLNGLPREWLHFPRFMLCIVRSHPFCVRRPGAGISVPSSRGP